MFRPKKWGFRPKLEGGVMAVLSKIAIFALLYGLIINNKKLMLMKQKLLLLLGALLMMVGNVNAAAPASYVKFSVNGTTPMVGFNKFSDAVPDPYNLGVVYKMLNEDKPNLGITGYQVVINTDREGFEYEDSHYMLVYIGVYDESITVTGAYYDRNEDGLLLLPRYASVPVRCGRQFFGGGTGALAPMNEVMSASQFVWTDGVVDDFVLPNPLVYDEATNSYKEGEYQKGHSYVIAIHFKEITHVTKGDEDGGLQPGWDYPQMSTEYTSWYWNNDYSKECLLARFTYAADEAVKTASVMMTVNGERKRFDLLGENQPPIDLGTIYKTEVTGHDGTWTLPDLGFNSFIVESAVPYTYSDATGVYGASMTFTTLPKSEADQIGEGFEVDNRDYKTANFGTFPAILCGTEEGLAKLSENWAYEGDPMDVWANWAFSGTHPIMAGWPLDGAFEDGETYTVAFYFSEYNDYLQPIFIHRNGGKYYKFNFTYKEKSQEQDDEEESKDILSTPLTLEAATSGAITFNLNLAYGTDPSVMNAIEYRKNVGEWTTYTWGDAIAVVEGDKVAFRGDNAKYFGNGTPTYDSHISSTADVYVYGNIMSLISSTDFATLTTLTGKDAFSHLFCVPGDNPWEIIPNTTIKSHPTKDLVLPATTLTNMCYQYMFAGCQGLTRAPELPATDMTVACYASMFQDCISLTKAPYLPAATFADYGYNEQTFEEYGSIDCYMEMFKGCTSLKEAQEILPATKLVHGVYQFMFAGCINLVKAPELPAEKVADLAYTNMFEGCSSLNFVKCLATEFEVNPEFGNTEEDNVKDWLKGVSATGTFIKAKEMTKWLSGASGIPEGWMVEDYETAHVEGDVTGEGNVDAKDLVEIVNFMMGKSKVTEAAADVNNDGEVNAADIVTIVNIIMR